MQSPTAAHQHCGLGTTAQGGSQQSLCWDSIFSQSVWPNFVKPLPTSQSHQQQVQAGEEEHPRSPERGTWRTFAEKHPGEHHTLRGGCEGAVGGVVELQTQGSSNASYTTSSLHITVRQQSCPQPLAEPNYCSLLPPSPGNSLLPCSPRCPGKAGWGTYGNRRAGPSSYGPLGRRSGWSRAAAAAPAGGAWCGGDGKHNSSWGWWWWSTPAKTLQGGERLLAIEWELHPNPGNPKKTMEKVIWKPGSEPALL